MINDIEHIHPDLDILKNITKKAYEVARFFEDNEMNEEFIVQYLNDKLPCDALCKFYLTSSVLHPEEVEMQDRVFSYSHKEWLNKLNRTKLQWTWKQVDVELEDTQSKKLEVIMNTYNELQKLALSYKC